MSRPRSLRETFSPLTPISDYNCLKMDYIQEREKVYDTNRRGSVAKETKGFKMNMKPDATVVI